MPRLSCVAMTGAELLYGGKKGAGKTHRGKVTGGGQQSQSAAEGKGKGKQSQPASAAEDSLTQQLEDSIGEDLQGLLRQAAQEGNEE